MSEYVIPDGADIGHCHLKVADLDRALAFWHGVLGFAISARAPQAAFLAAGGYHHHIALNTWDSRGGQPPPRGTTGLFHVAVRYPSRRDLARALRRVLAAGVPLHGASDHRVSLSIYLADPDGNGVELTCDTPRESWSRDGAGRLEMAMADPLDLAALLAEAGD